MRYSERVAQSNDNECVYMIRIHYHSNSKRENWLSEHFTNEDNNDDENADGVFSLVIIGYAFTALIIMGQQIPFPCESLLFQLDIATYLRGETQPVFEILRMF